jgi:predicted RNA binding protein YcfA (HicA-like mRNA interferase family)
MATESLKNITPNQFRRFLEFKGLKHIRTKGGHEIWSSTHLTRPVVLQTHENPIPEFIVMNNLRTMESTKKELLDFIRK